MLGSEFGDKAVKQELPVNRDSHTEAKRKIELPRTPLSRWIFAATIRPSPCLKTADSPTACFLFPAPLSPVTAVPRSFRYTGLSIAHQLSPSSLTVNERQSAQRYTTTPPPVCSSTLKALFISPTPSPNFLCLRFDLGACTDGLFLDFYTSNFSFLLQLREHYLGRLVSSLVRVTIESPS